MTILSGDPHAPIRFIAEMPVNNRYSYGLAGEHFFRVIKEEARILGTRCAKCGIIYVPPSIYCERCLSELDEWVDVGTTGEIHSFTVLHLDAEGSESDHPEVIALIRLGDGGLIHKIDGVSPADVFIGMKVSTNAPVQSRISSIFAQ